jgi:hypothetical protein
MPRKNIEAAGDRASWQWCIRDDQPDNVSTCSSESIEDPMSSKDSEFEPGFIEIGRHAYPVGHEYGRPIGLE